MKRFCLLLLSLLLAWTAAAEMPQQARAEWASASAFLETLGVHAEEAVVVYESPQCIYFAAPADSAFVLVAREKYKKALGSPILAYGTGNAVWLRSAGEEDQDEQDGFFLRILHLYEATLKALEHAGNKMVSLPKTKDAGPFCADTYYGQHLPFNRLFPIDGRGDNAWNSMVGCGPVALAKVLSYYKSPTQPKGVYSGKTLSGNPYTYDLADYPVDWNNLQAEVLLLDCAMSLGTQLGVGYSLTKLSQFKAALFDAWSYSPRSKLLTTLLKEDEMVRMIQEELAACRPVILAGGNHLFVCDGLHGDFLHLDFGWRGFGNGYFRTLLLPAEKNNWQLPFKEALIGIEPDLNHEYKEVTVKLSKEGTLANKLKNRHLVRKLTIKGPVNGADMDLIRQMAGAVLVSKDYHNEYGALTELDLSQAKLVANAPFHTRATQMEIKGTITPANQPAFDYHFKLDEATRADWDKMVSLGLDKHYGLAWQDGVVLVKHAMGTDTIVPLLFSDCLSLGKVILPKNLKKVDEWSFYNCLGLHQVENLPRDVHPRAFINCALDTAQ